MIGNFGLLNTGAVIKRITDIITQIGEGLGDDLGAAFELFSQTPEGQLINRCAEQASDLWELGEMIINSFSPQTANGKFLDDAFAMVFSERIPATASVANGVVITGTPSTVVPSSFQLSVTGNPSAIFQISQSVTIGGGGTVTVAFVCIETGPVAATAGQLTNIVTAVTGVVSCTNPTDAQLGSLAETDSAFRARAAQQLGRFGTGTPAGFDKAILAVANVSYAHGIFNDLNTVATNGIPPHAVETVVIGGIDQEVAQAIWNAKGGGITTYGNTAVTVQDAAGNAQTVNFSRVTNLQIYVVIAVTINTDKTVGPVYPPEGDAAVASAIASIVYGAGQTVTPLSIASAANSIAGVLTASVQLGTAPSPAGTSPISVPSFQIAQIQAANVTVNS